MFFVSTREEIREAAERAALQDNILEKLSYYRRLIRSCDYGAYPDAYYCRSLKDMGIALRYKAFVMYLLGRVFETFGIKTDVRNPGRSVKVDVFIEAGNDEDLLEDASDDFFEDIVNCPSFFLPDLEALGSVVFCIPIGEEKKSKDFCTAENAQTLKEILSGCSKDLKKRIRKKGSIRKVIDHLDEFYGTEVLFIEKSSVSRRIQDVIFPVGHEIFGMNVVSGTRCLKSADNLYHEIIGEDEVMMVQDFYYDEEIPYLGYVGENSIMAVHIFDRFAAMVCCAMAERGILSFGSRQADRICG